MGHGSCVVFSKQSALPRATRDALLIGQKAWMLLKSFAFDPSELRGIGIQITKLDDDSKKAEQPGRGQSTLAFPSSNAEKKDHLTHVVKEGSSGELVSEALPTLAVQPPSQEDGTVPKEACGEPYISGTLPVTNKGEATSRLNLPSLTQIDGAILDELPADVRAEIRMEYVRRSASPALSTLSTEDGNVIDGQVGKKRRTTDKGTPLRRITQALAPRSAPGNLPGPYGNIFERCKARVRGRSESVETGATDSEEPTAERFAARVKVSLEELKKLGIDAHVFTELPPDLQMEQLANARFSNSFGKRKNKA